MRTVSREHSSWHVSQAAYEISCGAFPHGPTSLPRATTPASVSCCTRRPTSSPARPRRPRRSAVAARVLESQL